MSVRRVPEETGSQRTLAVRCLTIRSRDPNTQSDVTASQDDIKMGPGNGPVTYANVDFGKDPPVAPLCAEF